MDEATAFWANGRGVLHITPKGKPWPEGKRFRTYLQGLAKLGRVVDFGCGVGRLSKMFAPSAYVGVDLSERVLQLARETNPLHTFQRIEPDDVLPEGDVTLAHTVLLHVPDPVLAAFAKRVRSPILVVSEIIGRRYAHPDRTPPTFNRDMGDYEAAMAPGFDLAYATDMPYTHYDERGGASLTVLGFERAGG